MLHIKIRGITKCSNMEANIFAAYPPPPPLTLAMGLIGQNSSFSEHSHVAYQIKQQYGCKYLPATPHPTPLGSKGQNSTFSRIPPPDPGIKIDFSEHVHVAHQNKVNHEMQQYGSRYFAPVTNQIKGNHKCSNMVANIIPAEPPPPPHTHTP